MGRMVPRWLREQTHPKGCPGCARAADNAKTNAIGDGLDEATYTFTRYDGDHTVTVRRPSTQTKGRT